MNSAPALTSGAEPLDRSQARRPRMGRPRSTDVHRRILEQTLDVISARGFSGVTINEICERAGVSRATFYRRFPTPAAAAAEAINTAFAFEELPHSNDPVEYLVEFAQALLRTYADPRIAPAIGFMIGEVNVSPELFERIQQGVLGRRAHVKRVVKALCAEGRWTGLDLDLVLTVLSSMVWEATAMRHAIDADDLRAIIRRLIF